MNAKQNSALPSFTWFNGNNKRSRLPHHQQFTRPLLPTFDREKPSSFIHSPTFIFHLQPLVQPQLSISPRSLRSISLVSFAVNTDRAHRHKYARPLIQRRRRHVELCCSRCWCSSIIVSYASLEPKFCSMLISHSNDAADSCALSISTVFVTPSPPTVTVHDAASTSTVFITASSTVGVEISEVPKPTTVTAISTLLSTTTASEAQSISAGGNEKGVIGASDLVTSTLTAYVTVPYVEKSPTTSTEAIIGYYVQDGTTHYLDGQTPSPSESYVYLSNAVTVTVEPTAAAPATPEGTSTTVVHTTVTSFQHVTFTQSLSAKGTASASVGTPSKFTGIGPDGWNTTSTAYVATGTGVVGTVISARSGFGGQSSYSIATDSTFDVYGQHSIVPLSTMSAAAGFSVYTSLSDPTAPSTVDAASTTSSIEGKPTSSGTSFANPLFSNSTLLSPRPTTNSSVIVVPTSSFSTVYTAVPLALNSSTDGSGISTISAAPSPSTTAESSVQVSTSASSTFSNATVASSTSSATPSQSSCGLVGDFTMNVSHRSSVM